MTDNPVFKNNLSLESEIPLYAQLTGIIQRTITSGALKIGDLLPSETELCREFDISRNTVRQAIGALEEEGFVVRKRGKGTFEPIRTRDARACSTPLRPKYPKWGKRRPPPWWILR